MIWIAVAARLRPERMLYQGASEGRAVQVEIRPPLQNWHGWVKMNVSDTVKEEAQTRD